MNDPQKPVGEIGERQLVRHIRARVPQGSGVGVGLGDDAAAIETGALTLVTTDSLVEGRQSQTFLFAPAQVRISYIFRSCETQESPTRS